MVAGETTDVPCFHRVIDSVLADVPGRDQIIVGRAKLDLSWEAWMHVKIIGPLLALAERAAPSEVILTWPNSD